MGIEDRELEIEDREWGHSAPYSLPPTPDSRFPTRYSLALYALLLAAVGLVFLQTAAFDFINYDDHSGVCDNPRVTRPLTLGGIKAAFTERHVESWAPLTCVSHMLVWHLLGPDASVHHLTNVLLHAASAVLLLLVLWQMTGQKWPSALAAAIFAVHPLRAESVAWVTERKDVLSGLFFMLTLAAYVRYVRGGKKGTGAFCAATNAARRCPPEGRSGERCPSLFSLRYLTVLVAFIVSLAAKPMAVTLPFLLLVLDYWPLGRMNGTKPRSSIAPARARSSIAALSAIAPYPARSPIAALWRLIPEKIPLLVIAGLFCLLTFHGQEAAALTVNRQYSLAWRIGNALVSYAAYVGQFFCPVNLAPAYPRRLLLPNWQVVLAVLVLVSITSLVLRWRSQRPYLLVGWLWYVGMLVPVIGLVQFGAQAEADRFTYLPEIGLCIALAWAAAEVLGDRKSEAPKEGETRKQGEGETGESRLAAGCPCLLVSPSPLLPLSPSRPLPSPRSCLPYVCTAVALAVLIGWGWRQTRLWRTSKPLWAHALLCTPESAVAHDSFGSALSDEGRLGEAIVHFRKALQLDPLYVGAYNNLGAALFRCGQFDEAMTRYRTALSIDPNDAEAHHNLGNVLARKGQIDEATVEYRLAVKFKPYNAEARYHLGVVLQWRRPEEAMAQFQAAIALSPRDVRAYNHLAEILVNRQQFDEAIKVYRAALAIKPNFVQARNGLGQALVRKGRLAEATHQFRQAIRSAPDFARAHTNLGAIFEAQHHDDEAAAEYQKAVAADPKDLRALKCLAWLRATSPAALLRDGDQAVALAQRANALSGGKLPEVLEVLAAAYAEVGRFDDALSTAKQAVELAEREKNEPLADALRAQLSRYREGLAFRH